MNVFIAGGGRVGFHLAQLLGAEKKHDISVIENNTTAAEQIDYALDVRTVAGDAASVLLQREAGVGTCDVFVAVTGQDEVNLIAAATAKGLGAKQVVARVDDAMYIESNILYETILGIDYILSPEALTALEVAKYVENPGVVAAEDFGRGLVQMRQMRVSVSPTVNGLTLKDICPPGCGVLVGLISRGGDIMVPDGEAVIEPNDLVTFIGRRDKINDIMRQFQGTEPKATRVAIMGGSSVGLHLAQLLEGRQPSVKLFDWDLSRCNYLASRLKRTKIVCRDGTSRIALEQEHIADYDVFVSTTNDDEHNIMAAVLAKEVGAEKTIAVVHQPDFAPLVRRLGINHAVTPRASIANRILRLVHQRRVTSLAILEEGKAEIIELPVEDDSPAIGSALRDVRLPRGTLVASILRGDEVIVPSGADTIEAGDSVVIIGAPEKLEAVRKMFHP